MKAAIPIRMRRRQCLVLWATLVLAVSAFSRPGMAAEPRGEAHDPPQKKLINWSDHVEINRDLIHDHYHIQRMPFDGGVFHAPGNVEMRIFSAEPIHKAEVDALIAIMKQTNFTRFTDNFLAISMYTWGGRLKTPPLRWEDDAGWKTVAANMGQIARLASEGGFVGMLIDTEPYTPVHLTNGSSNARLAEARGKQVMEAMKQHFPDIKIMVTMGYVAMTQKTWYGYFPTSPNVTSGFLDGLLLGSDPRYRYIEGLGAEQAYGVVKTHGTPGEPGKPAPLGKIGSGTGDPGKPGFKELRDMARDPDCDHVWSAFRSTRQSRLLKLRGRVGFGHYHNAHASAGTTVEALRNGLAETDEYVWVYSGDPPYSFWRHSAPSAVDGIRNNPMPRSVPVAKEIAAWRGPRYAFEYPAPKPVYAEISQPIKRDDGTTKYTVTVTSFRGSITHFHGTLLTDSAIKQIDLDLEAAPVTKILDVIVLTGQNFTLRGEVTNRFGKNFPVAASYSP